MRNLTKMFVVACIAAAAVGCGGNSDSSNNPDNGDSSNNPGNGDSSSTPDDAAKLVGDWRMSMLLSHASGGTTSYQVVYIYSFKKDGTYTQTYTSAGTLENTENGKYSVASGTITFTSIVDDTGSQPDKTYDYEIGNDDSGDYLIFSWNRSQYFRRWCCLQP